MTSGSVLEFLRESLNLWGVEGSVEPGEPPLIAIVHSASGTTVWIEPIHDADVPFRWAVRWRSGDPALPGAHEIRPKRCASLVGLLGALRLALAVDRGSPVRVASHSQAALSIAGTLDR